MTAGSILVAVAVVASPWWMTVHRRSRVRLVAATAGVDDRGVWPFPRYVERREARNIATDLPRLAEAIARDVRSGRAMVDAVLSGRDVVGGVTSADLDVVDRVLGSGASMADALTAWRDRRAVPALDQFVGTVLLGAELGGRAAGALEAVATSLRDQAEILDEVRSLTAQSRASAVLLTGLPPLAAAGLAVIEPATAQFLFRTTAGWTCLAIATALVASGWWWMDRLCRFER